MPRVVPILPSTKEDEVKAQVTKILEAAAACEFALDPQGFVSAWMADSARLVIAYDEGEKPVGLGFMVSGRRWFDEALSASVLFSVGPASKDVLAFLLDTAKLLGATKLFYEGDELGGEDAGLRVLEIR